MYIAAVVKNVEEFFRTGCGRCSHWNTPDCKALQWGEGLAALRTLMLKTELHEEVKWGFPCYTMNGKNVIMIQAFRQYFALAFFKGELLDDPNQILVIPGEQSQAARQVRFQKTSEVLERSKAIVQLIEQSIALERSGKKLPPKEKKALELPEELLQVFHDDPVLRAAFEALTPGRQRGYQIIISQAKQSKTRMDRIEKYRSNILNGKGYQE